MTFAILPVYTIGRKADVLPTAHNHKNGGTMRYSVKFTGRLSVEAENEEEALTAFWALIVEMLREEDVTDVTAAAEEGP
jgi:hypothetical protein